MNTWYNSIRRRLNYGLTIVLYDVLFLVDVVLVRSVDRLIVVDDDDDDERQLNYGLTMVIEVQVNKNSRTILLSLYVCSYVCMYIYMCVSKSIQYMKGMYRTRVRSLLIHPRRFQSQTPWELIRKNSECRGSRNRKNSEFARPICVNTLTRDIARSFSQVFTISVPERTQILHEFYRNSVSFYYSFCYLHHSNYFRSYTN